MMNKAPVITIDGPSGVGKSTVSKIIAKKLNWSILESGKIYRLLAFLALENNFTLIEKDLILLAKNLDFFLKKNDINNFYNLINSEKISEVSSKLATHPKIRKILLKKQRLLRILPGLVAEGRDMGTVVFPDAEFKFFLHADLNLRVKRRMKELNKNGFYINFQQLFIQMKNRDIRDQNRLISPLCIPKDAIILNCTNMSLSDIIKNLMQHILKEKKI